jgi:hypothetical protein
MGNVLFQTMFCLKFSVVTALQHRIEDNLFRACQYYRAAQKLNDSHKNYYNAVPYPPVAQLDALHIATATVYEMDYMLTWNCKHIANASKRHTIEKVCQDQGYRAPILTTPLELMEN